MDRHLNTGNVNAASFGNATFFPADGQMYPQVLFAPRVWVAGAQRDMAFGATEHSSVYAWDLCERTFPGIPMVPILAVNFDPTLMQRLRPQPDRRHVIMTCCADK